MVTASGDGGDNGRDERRWEVMIVNVGEDNG